MFRPVSLLCLLGALAGCGQAGPAHPPPGSLRTLELEARPIGRGARFQPPVLGPVVGGCSARLGKRFGVHLEVFAANRVVVVARGIGVRGIEALNEGRIARARCFGALVTLEPTGVVLVRAGERVTLGDLFRAWGTRLADYPRAYVSGRPERGDPAAIRLLLHREIVVEAGPFVPPHKRYAFPPGS